MYELEVFVSVSLQMKSQMNFIKTYCIICVLFSTEFCLFNNFILFCSKYVHVFHNPYAKILIPTSVENKRLITHEDYFRLLINTIID